MSLLPDSRIKRILVRIYQFLLLRILNLHRPWRKRFKEREELRYWRTALKNSRKASQSFAYFFTTHFKLEKEFYRDKVILDIGCGPRGSLEWADIAARRIGLDPLADKYLELGASAHKMEYITAEAEGLPFEDNTFDVVSAFNSLDHVEDIDKVIAEIKRVLKPGGTFLLLMDTHDKPTFWEPQVVGPGIVGKFEPEFTILAKDHFVKGDHGLYQSLLDAVKYEEEHKGKYGVLSARFVKN